MKYQIIKSKNGNTILLRENGVLISFSEDPKNMDYQTYLNWVAEGNFAEILDQNEL